MYEKKYSKFLTVILIISAIAAIILICYFVYDIFTKYNTNKEAEAAVDAFQQQFANKNNNSFNNNGNNFLIELTNNITGENVINDNVPENPNIDTDINENSNVGNGNNGNTSNGNTNKNTSSGGSVTKYAGYTMIGTIQIPKINVKIPIVKELTIDSLKKSSVLIYGNINEEGNAVIIGHNNRNGTYFSNIKKLNSGDRITITDDSGFQIEYEVYDIFLASPDDTSFYQRDTGGLREITLSTCTDNDDSLRNIVFAREI